MRDHTSKTTCIGVSGEIRRVDKRQKVTERHHTNRRKEAQTGMLDRGTRNHMVGETREIKFRGRD